jgi:hypothetical protein
MSATSDTIPNIYRCVKLGAQSKNIEIINRLLFEDENKEE